MRQVAVVHYHEIGLKGNNRLFFERRLQQNIELATKEFGIRTERLSGRLVVPIPEGVCHDVLACRLRKVFGIVYFAFAWECAQEIDQIQSLLERDLGRPFQSFRIHTRRSEKNIPMTSQQFNEILGAYVVRRTGRKVDLTRPDLTFYVEMVQGRCYVYCDRVDGSQKEKQKSK